MRILLPISGLAMIIPPILPMAMAWSLHWANMRLRDEHKVYCTYPSLIVVAGGINCVCFDKVLTCSIQLIRGAINLITAPARSERFYCSCTLLLRRNL